MLDIDGHRLRQSLAIIDYLDQTRGLGLLPLDPVQRAKVSGLARRLAMDVHPICNLPVVRYAAGITGDETIKGDWMQRFIGPGLTAFETLLTSFKQDPFCNGSKPGLVDICLIPQLYNASRWNASFADCPKICTIATHCAALPAFADAHPDRVKPQSNHEGQNAATVRTQCPKPDVRLKTGLTACGSHSTVVGSVSGGTSQNAGLL